MTVTGFEKLVIATPTILKVIQTQNVHWWPQSKRPFHRGVKRRDPRTHMHSYCPWKSPTLLSKPIVFTMIWIETWDHLHWTSWPLTFKIRSRSKVKVITKMRFSWFLRSLRIFSNIKNIISPNMDLKVKFNAFTSNFLLYNVLTLFSLILSWTNTKG